MTAHIVMNSEEFLANEEIMLRDALHSWWDEYPDDDDELDNEHYDERESEGYDSPQEEYKVSRMTLKETENMYRSYYECI